MVEIKIACQCGVPFRYGLELVEGRAPEGVGCPTCNAPITSACNALIDHLTGKLPTPDPSGTRVLKDIKVTCACGARYKFELELAERTMPSAVVCPACQAELTEAANQELARFATRFTDILPLPPLAASAAPVVTAAPPPPAPAPAPAPANSPETPPAQPVTAPAAVLPVLPVPQSPAPAPAAPAPAPASAQETPTNQTASAATVGAVLPPSPSGTKAPAPAAPPGAPAVAAPGVIPEYGPLFPPAEPTKPPPKGMPNLKPLEVPRMERPARPAGSAAAAAKPPATAPGQPKPDSGPAARADAKPAPAKPAAKPPAKPVAKVQVVREVNVPLGAAGAFVGALVGAGLWLGVLQAAPAASAYLALLVGVLAGLGARLLGRGTAQVLGAIACVMSVVFIGVMSWITMNHHINQLARPSLNGRYASMLAEAKEAVAAKSDADLKRIVARSVPTADPTMMLVSDADLQAFKVQRMPFLQDLASGKVSQAQFESRELAKYRTNFPLDEAWEGAIGIGGLLCALAGIIAGAKIAFKTT